MKIYAYGPTMDCRVCHRELPSTEFYLKDKESGRRASKCRRCQIHDNREKKLGVTEADYLRMLEDQNARCAICKRTVSETHDHNQRFAVDHNHDTRQVRGLLCSSCNTAIGLLKDDPVRINNALHYLKCHKQYDLYVPLSPEGD